MARTVEVTKVGVTCAQKGLHMVTLKLKYKEDAATLFEQDFSEGHKNGQSPSDVTVRFKSEMQKAIDFYKEAENVSNHAQMSSAITDLQNSLSA